MAGRKTVVFASAISAYISGAAAQSLGAELTVEESLVEFTNTVTTFQVETASEVLLFIVMPIIGFYFLIKNFTAMGYETFEERIGRHNYKSTDDEIPTGMKGFSLVASATTVLTIGAVSSGLLALTGLAALALATAIYAGLMPSSGGSSGRRPPEPEPEPQPEPSKGPDFEDYKELGEQLVHTGREIGKGYSNRSRERRQEEAYESSEEALRLFRNDFIDELHHVKSDYSRIDSLLSRAENEISHPSDIGPEVFKDISQRVEAIDKLLDSYLDQEPVSVGLYHDSISERDFKQEIFNLESQLKRVLNSESITPPDDVFNELIDELRFVVASAHFVHHSPVPMSELSSDQDAAKGLISKAASMQKVEDRPDREEVKELAALAAWLDENKDILTDTIIRSERLCRKEMSISKSELKLLKNLLKKDGEIHSKLQAMASKFSIHSAVPKEFLKDIMEAESKMKDLDKELASLEDEVERHGKFESDIYKKLKELEQQI